VSHILLVGNGPNYFSGRWGWDDAIRVVARRVRLSNQVENLIHEPLPLVYETMASGYPDAEREAKEDLAQQMQAMKPNDIHTDLMALGWSTVLTTNYDNCLEAATGERFETDNLERESTYSVFRRKRSKTQFVWHIHGELSGPRTMMLGLHQYAGYLQKLRQYFTTKMHGSPYVYAGETWSTDADKHSWADHFLRDNVHIVGFGFGYAETVLWWLLTYKQRIRRAKGLHTGTTTYYQMGNPAPTDKRLLLMDALGVKIRHIPSATGKPTKDSWAQVINLLKAMPH
jgi:hypothetical protein